MSGIFAQWQPRYAEHRMATFPVTPNKTPAVKGYLRVGMKGSEQLAAKFAQADAFGLACRRNRITILDIDTPDERVLADGLAKHGPSPFIVRSGSGNWQVWYRNSGERRRVRPVPDVPIDVLGDGFVVAPPSIGKKGQYEIVQGSLADLARLPPMRLGGMAGNCANLRSFDDPMSTAVDSAQPSASLPKVQGEENSSAARDGKRNDTLWRYCMKVVRSCQKIEHLMEAAMEYNKEEFYRPLPADEVLKIVASAWGYEVEGKNWFGYGPRVILAADEVDDLAATNPQAFALLSILRRHHAGSKDFIVAKAMAERFGWTLRSFKAARNLLLERGLIECIHVGGRGKNDPPVYRFPKARKGCENAPQY